MPIMINALRENVRRKQLYIVAVIGLLIIALFTTGDGVLTVDGVPITDYSNMITIILAVINTISGVLAIILSMNTIPNEYERKTSHLVWIRGISQAQYHGELAFANVISSCIATGIMYIGVFIFMVSKDESEAIIRLIPSLFILCLSIIIISLFTSALSINLPRMVVGLLATVFYLVGILHGILDVVKSNVMGFASSFLRYLLLIIPDLNEIQWQAGNTLKGNGINFHVIIKALLIIYIITIFIILWKRKEA